MNTYEFMSAQEYQDCLDAGRGPEPDPLELADNARKEQKEGGTVRYGCKCGQQAFDPRGVCWSCGSPCHHCGCGGSCCYCGKEVAW